MPFSSLPRWVFALLSTALAVIVLAFLFIHTPTPVTAQSSDLITNGVFADSSAWAFVGSAQWSSNYGGTAYVPNSSSIITQSFTVSESGVYQFQLQCRGSSAGHQTRTSIIGTTVNHTFTAFSCGNQSWNTQTTSLNLPPQTYTLSIWRTSGSPYVDNVTLQKVADLTDIETGLLSNGDFIDPSHWSYTSPGKFEATLGHTTLGSAYATGSGQVAQQLYLDGGSYRLTFPCTGSSTPQATYIIQSSSLSVSGSSITCGSVPTWLTYTTSIFYLPPNTYTLSLKPSHSLAKIYVDDIKLIQEDTVADLDTGFIRDGDLLNTDEWVWTNTSYNLGKGSFNLGSAYFSASGNTRELKQEALVIPSTGSYVLTVDCLAGSTDNFSVGYRLQASGLATLSGYTPCQQNWISGQVTHTLQAATYTLTIFMDSWKSSYVDDISLFPAALNDIDTGYIPNGDFIGSTSWTLGGGVLYDAKPGHTERGSLYFPSTAGQVVTQSLGSLEAGVYDLTLYCSNYRPGRPGSLELHLTTAAGTFSDTFIDCSAALDYPWISYTTPLTLPTTVPTATLVMSHTDLTGALAVYLDDVQLFRRPNLLDQQTFSCNSGLCSGSTAQGSVSGSLGQINTHSGSYSFQALDLLVPVAGEALSFSRHYASGRSQLQTEGHPLGVLGQGWVHNYETRLILDDNLTTLDNSVEVQTSSGSYLPFIQQPDGSFEPYAGVLAELVENLDGTYTLTTPELLVYTFNVAGQLIHQEDALGQEITFSYNGSGQLFRASQGGRYLEYAYFTSGPHTGQLQTVTDHAGRSISLTYSANGFLETVDNPLDQTTSYVYSGTTSLLTAIVDPTSRVVEQISYNPAGQALAVADGSNYPALQVAYLPSHQTVITQTGAVMTHTYGAHNTLEEISFACPDGSGSCQATAGHNSQFRHQAITDANLNPTALQWSADGVNVVGMTNALADSTSFEYDAFHNLISMTDAQGVTTTYEYNHPSFPTFQTAEHNALGGSKIYTPTAEGWLAAVEDENGSLTTYAYDAYGQVLTSTSAANTSSATSTTYGYNNLGQLITTTTSTGVVTVYTYDLAGRLTQKVENFHPGYGQNGLNLYNLTTSHSYDAAGRLVSTTDTLGKTNLTLYDTNGRPVKRIANYDGVTDVNTLCTPTYYANPDPEFNLCSATSYDEYGRVSATTNSLGVVNRTFYDDLGRVLGTVQNSVQITNSTQLESCFSLPLDRDHDVCSQNSYDAMGNLIISTDTVGRQTRTFYDALNRSVATIQNWSGTIDSLEELDSCFTLPENRTSDICSLTTYDEVGRVIISTDTVGQMTRNFYDDLNRLVATVRNWNAATLTTPSQCVLAPNNTQTENICTVFGYDAAGNQISSTNALSQTSYTVYDAADRLYISVQNWDGVTEISNHETDCVFSSSSDSNLCSVTLYNELGQMVETINPMGYSTTTTYNSLGQVASTTRYLGAQPVTTSSVYDALGNVVNSISAEGEVVTTTYDSLYRTLNTISAEGVVITHTYDALGRVVETVNGLGHTTSTTYDDLGRVVASTNANEETTTTEYNVLGQQVATVNPLGQRTEYLYDELGRQVEVIQNVDGTGIPTAEANVSTTMVYNVLGQQVAVVNALGITTTSTLYDDLRRPAVVSNALGQTTLTTYNALGLKLTVTNPLNQETEYSYDGLNRLVEVYYAAEDKTVSTTYNAQGQKLVLSEPLGDTTTTYDTLGRVISVTDPFSQTIGYEYNLNGQRTTLIYPDLKEVHYTYDQDGRLLTVTDWLTQTTTYTYDQVGQLIELTFPNGVLQTNSYDPAGRLLERSYTAGETLLGRYEYQLNELGQTVYITETVLTPELIETIETYQAQSGVLNLALSNGVLTPTAELPISLPSGEYTVWAHAWDNGFTNPTTTLQLALDNGTTVLTNSLSSFPTSGWAWTTGGSSTLTAAGAYTLTAGLVGEGVQADRLLFADNSLYDPNVSNPELTAPTFITQVIPSELVTQTIALSYDGLNRVTEAEYNGAYDSTFGYEYNALGSRLTYTEGVTVTTYSYNAADYLLESVTNNLTTTYSWNAAGQLITTTVSGQPTAVYTYDQRGNLTLAVTNGLTTTFVYNGHNQRLQLSVNGQPTTYLLDYARGGNRVLQESNALETKFYLYGDHCLAELVETDNPAEPEQRYYLYDGSQTVRQTVNEQAEPTYAWTFSPEGAVLLGEEGPVSHLSCVGDAVYDWSTGLIFKGGKYYDPRSDLWLTFGSPAVVWAVNRRNGYGSKRKDKKQDKRFFWLLFLLLVLFVLAGCGPTPTPTSPTPTPVANCDMPDEFYDNRYLANSNDSNIGSQSLITVNANIVYIGVDPSSRNIKGSSGDVDYANSVFKQANVQLNILNTFDLDKDIGIPSSDFLDSEKQFDGAYDDQAFNSGRDGVGLVIYYVPDYSYYGGEGYEGQAFPGKNASIVISMLADHEFNNPRTLGHELGHIMGLGHPNYDDNTPHDTPDKEIWYDESNKGSDVLKREVLDNLMTQSSDATGADQLTKTQIEQIRQNAAGWCTNGQY